MQKKYKLRKIDSFNMNELTINLRYDSGYFASDTNFEVHINGNGAVFHSCHNDNEEQITYNDKAIIFHENISQQLVIKIVEKLLHIGFLDMKDQYSGESFLKVENNIASVMESSCTDLPSYTVSIEIGDKKKEVWDYEGAPSGLKELEQLIIDSCTIQQRESKHKPRKCPNCGENAVVDILYGMPTAEAFELEKEGKLIIGGCCLSSDNSRWQCSKCGCRISKKG